MKETRFHFADAAATGYLRSIVAEGQSHEIITNVAELRSPVNYAPMGIVGAFIQKRGYAYRTASE
jgi:hypothetical protein